MSDVEITGGCYCGDVRYRATASPRHPSTCYCEGCARTVGSTVTVWVQFPTDAFEFMAVVVLAMLLELGAVVFVQALVDQPPCGVLVERLGAVVVDLAAAAQLDRSAAVDVDVAGSGGDRLAKQVVE